MVVSRMPSDNVIYFDSQSDLTSSEFPRLMSLDSNLYALIFDLVKIIPARYIVRCATLEGKIDHHTQIFESTSGSMGLALATVCHDHNLPLTIVGDDAIDSSLRIKLESLGANVVLLSEPYVDGPQRDRLRCLEELLRESSHAYWTQQYDNPIALKAYVPLGKTLRKILGPLDVLVASVGTGASACGLIEGIRDWGDRTRLVAVDTIGSVLFGHKSKARVIRGLGNSIIPANLLHQRIDECHWVPAQDILVATRHLHTNFGIDGGPTSGATYLVASFLHRKCKNLKIVFVCADTGNRYRTTVLSAKWQQDNNLWRTEMPAGPITVQHPDCNVHSWCKMDWNRRSLSSVLPSSQ
jgi:cysteine synthase